MSGISKPATESATVSEIQSSIRDLLDQLWDEAGKLWESNGTEEDFDLDQYLDALRATLEKLAECIQKNAALSSYNSEHKDFFNIAEISTLTYFYIVATGSIFSQSHFELCAKHRLKDCHRLYIFCCINLMQTTSHQQVLNAIKHETSLPETERNEDYDHRMTGALFLGYLNYLSTNRNPEGKEFLKKIFSLWAEHSSKKSDQAELLCQLINRELSGEPINQEHQGDEERKLLNQYFTGFPDILRSKYLEATQARRNQSKKLEQYVNERYLSMGEGQLPPAITHLRPMNFQQAQQERDELIKSILDLEIDDNKKIAFKFATKLQLACAMMTRLTTDPKASAIARLPKQALLEFEIELRTKSSSTGTETNTLFVSLFNDARQIISDYNQVLDCFVKQQTEIKAKQIEFHAVEIARLISPTALLEQNNTVSTIAFEDLLRNNIINDAGLTEEFEALTIRTEKQKKERKGKASTQQTSLIKQIQSHLRIDAPKALDTTSLTTALTNQPCKARAGAGGPPPREEENLLRLRSEDIMFETLGNTLLRHCQNKTLTLDELNKLFKTALAYLEAPMSHEDKQSKSMQAMVSIRFNNNAFTQAFGFINAYYKRGNKEAIVTFVRNLTRFNLAMQMSTKFDYCLDAVATNDYAGDVNRINYIAIVHILDYLLWPSTETLAMSREQTYLAIKFTNEYSHTRWPAKDPKNNLITWMESEKKALQKNRKPIEQKLRELIDGIDITSLGGDTQCLIKLTEADSELLKFLNESFDQSITSISTTTPDITRRHTDSYRTEKMFHDQCMEKMKKAKALWKASKTETIQQRSVDFFVRDLQHSKRLTRKEIRDNGIMPIKGKNGLSCVIIGDQQKRLEGLVQRGHSNLNAALTDLSELINQLSTFPNKKESNLLMTGFFTLTDLVMNYLFNDIHTMTSEENQLSKETQENFIQCCVNLMHFIELSDLFNQLESTANKKDVALADEAIRKAAIFCAFLYYLTTEKSEQDKDLLAKVTWFRLVYTHNLTPNSRSLELVERAEADSVIKQFSDEQHINQLLIWRALTGEKTGYTFLNTFADRINVQYVATKDCEKRYEQMLEEACQEQSERLEAYIDKCIKAYPTFTDIEETNSDDEGVEESKSEPYIKPITVIQKKVLLSIFEFRRLDFNEAKEKCEQYLSEIDELIDATAQEKLCLTTDIKLQLARAMISPLNKSPKAGEIAKIPNQILEEFEAALHKLRLRKKEQINPALVGIFNEIRSLMNDYCRVIENFRDLHLSIRASIQKQWEKARRTGNFTGKLFQRRGKSNKTLAFNNLKEEKIIRNNELSADYVKPIRTNQHFEIKGKRRGKVERKLVSKTIDLVQSTQTLLQLETLETPDSREIDAAMGKPEKCILAGAGGPGPKKANRRRKKIAKPDHVSDKINDYLSRHTRDFEPSFLENCHIYGGAIRDWYLDKTPLDIDVRYVGSIEQFKTQSPGIKTHPGVAELSLACAKHRTGDNT